MQEACRRGRLLGVALHAHNAGGERQRRRRRLCLLVRRGGNAASAADAERTQLLNHGRGAGQRGRAEEALRLLRGAGAQAGHQARGEHRVARRHAAIVHQLDPGHAVGARALSKAGEDSLEEAGRTTAVALVKQHVRLVGQLRMRAAG